MAEQLEGGVEVGRVAFGPALTPEGTQLYRSGLERDRERLQAERDRLTQQRDDLLAWLEEQVKEAEHVAEKLKREADDFEDRAYYEDAERFTVQATAYQAVIQRLKEEGE